MTDHQPLKWLFTTKTPTGRIARWALQIQQYNIKIEYTPGKSNAIADMLSRPTCSEDQHTEVCICAFHIDVQFIFAVMQQVTYCLGIQQSFTPVYHPEANPVERKNRDLKAQLAILVKDHHETWHENLAAIRFAMNTAKCQSTGHSAAFLTFGRELRTLDDVQHDVKAIIEDDNFLPQITPLRNSAKRRKRNRASAAGSQ